MHKFKNFILGGIQQKVFNLVLYAIILIVLAYTLVLVHQSSSLRTIIGETNERQKESVTQTTQTFIDDNLTSSMGKATQMQAYIADDMFRDVATLLKTMHGYMERLYDSPEAYPAREVAPPDPAREGETCVQLLTEAGVDLANPDVASQVALAGNISDLLMSLYDGAQINSCYVALPCGVMLLADNNPASKFSEDGTVTPIAMTKRPWYIGAVEKKGIFYTDVATDVFTGQSGVMCGMPVYHDGNLVAVVGVDLLLDRMAQAVEGSESDNGFIFIVNNEGHVAFSPKTEGLFKVEDSSLARDLRQTSAELSQFVAAALEGQTEPTVVEVDDTSYYMCGAPIESVGWAVVNAVDKQATDAVGVELREKYDSVVDEAVGELTGSVSRSLVTIVVLVLIMTGLALTGALVLSKRIVRPLGLITDRVRSLGGDDLQFTMEDEYRTGDEIEVLAENFAELSGKTLQYMDQVTRVTAEKERMSAELNMATAIQASQLPRLFPAFPNRPEFEIYASMVPAKEVGGDFYDFFLIDDDHIGMVMADVSGKGIPAALFMMVSRVLIKSHLQNGESPSETLSNVNDQLCEGNEADLFVTVWLAVLQISTGRGVAANAGHEHPALRRAGKKYELQIYRHSPAVATMEGIPFREHDFMMRPGDSLFVYTDGVPEATDANKRLFGNDRMLAALNANPDATPEEILAKVTEDIDVFVAGEEQFDDTTMLCFKYKGPKWEQG